METEWKISDKIHMSLSEIEPQLFIGNENVAWYYPRLKENGITAVVSILRDRDGKWGRDSYRAQVPRDRHLFIAALDSDTQDLLVYIDEICDFVDKQMNETSGAVLIHCSLGVSRSATAVIAYLMRKRHESLDNVLKFVKEKRKVNPNSNFMEQLRVWEETAYEIWEDAATKLPKAPYQDYLKKRAERLKTKGLTGDEPVGLVAL